MNTRLFSSCVLVIAVAALALPTQGTMLLNVDLNGGSDYTGSGTGPTYSGPGIVSLSPTDQWNGITAPAHTASNPFTQFSVTAVPLIDSTGTATSATLTMTNMSWAVTLPSAFASTPYNPLMEDFFGENMYTMTFTFHNLPANDFAQFVLYGQAQSGGPSAGSATINASTLSWSNNGTPSTLTAGVNYVDFPSVQIDATGTLVITVNHAVSHEVDINGFQLIIPEPASMALLGFCSVPLILRRRHVSYPTI